MRKIIFAALGLIVLLVATLLIAPGLIPSSVYKDRIEAQLSKELGRSVSIEGDIKIASFPFIRAKTNDVSVENYAGFQNEKFINIKELEAKIRLMPLFSKRVEIEGFTLEGTEIFLERKKNGDVNWVDPNASQNATSSPNESFKRDGRFTSFDPQISNFDIKEGRLLFSDTLNNETYEARNITGKISLPGLNSRFKTDISLIFQEEAIDINFALETPEQFLKGAETPFTFKMNTEFASINAEGKFTESEAIDITSVVNLDVSDIQKLASFSPETIPYVDLLGTMKADGTLTFKNKIISMRDVDAQTSQGDVNGTFKGNISLQNTPKMDGQFDFNVPDFQKINQKLDLQSPYSASIKTITAQGSVVTEGDIISLSDLSAKLSDGLINADFSGTANYASKKSNPLSLVGTFSGDVTDIRQLAAFNGTELPENTGSNKIFEAASLSGKLNGTTQTLSMSDLNINFDQISGSGTLDIIMGAEQPTIDGVVSLNGLDLRPYMASYSSQNPTGEIQAWSESTFNVEAFKALNANILISTPNIITDRLSLNQSDIQATLNNGVLKADIPNLSLYGGSGRGDLTFDTSKSIPELTLNFSMDKLNGEGFLGAVAGFTKVIGTAGTNISIKASGDSQAALMKSMGGQGKFGLTGGQIKGIDIVKFTTGLNEAFKTRSLPQGLGVSELTAFQALEGLFSINNGVVTINEFDVTASGVSAKGLGKIDLGNQTIDFKLRPRLNSETSSSLGAFGIPLQFSGNFGGASASLDTNFLTQIIEGEAKAKLADTVRGQVKGPVGDILSGVLGGGSNQTPSQGGETPTQPPSNDEVINSVIGGLFGNKSDGTQKSEDTTVPQNQTTQSNENESPSEDKKEDKTDIEKALGSLFGD